MCLIPSQKMLVRGWFTFLQLVNHIIVFYMTSKITGLTLAVWNYFWDKQAAGINTYTKRPVRSLKQFNRLKKSNSRWPLTERDKLLASPVREWETAVSAEKHNTRSLGGRTLHKHTRAVRQEWMPLEDTRQLKSNMRNMYRGSTKRRLQRCAAPPEQRVSRVYK